MANLINRRSLLKRGVFLTGGFTILPGIFNQTEARPFFQQPARNRSFFNSDQIAFETTPPDIKARLLANENPFGPSEKAKKAIQEALSTCYQYPIDGMRALEQKITESEGLNKGQVLLAAGSSPLLLAATLSSLKGTVITAALTYEDVPSHAAFLGAKVIRVPMRPEYTYDLDAIEKQVDSSTSLVYICNPNNPSGTIVDNAKLKAFCERVSKITTVFVDEAYIDYLPDPQGTTLIENVKKGQNLIVARTFSKLYGFAGLRVGYVIAQPEMISKLNMYTIGPFGMSATSLNAAIAAYKEQDYLQEALKKTLASRQYLYDVLKAEGYTYIPSSTNFVLFPIKMKGERFVDEMMKRGVGIRSWYYNNQDYCRVSIGRMDEMQAFAAAFKELS